METHGSRSRPLFLVADDDQSMLLLLRAALEQADFDMIEAMDSSQALEAFIRFRPDLSC
jgi:DNA-binding response OmpR family regulator